MSPSKGPVPSRCPRHLVRLLGKVPDSEIARRSGRCIITARKWRRLRGIAACGRVVQPSPELPAGHCKLLGKVSDLTVGLLAGIPRAQAARAARAAREKAGIPPWKGRNDHVCDHGVPPDWCVQGCESRRPLKSEKFLDNDPDE